MNRLHGCCRAFALLLCISLASSPAAASNWIGGDGDWSDPANWDAGVPSETLGASVNQGVARYQGNVVAGGLLTGLNIAGRSNPTLSVVTGRVAGEGDLRVIGGGVVGHQSGTGQGNRRTGIGSLEIINGDLRIFRMPVPDFGVTVGAFTIGFGSGTGTNTRFTGEGSVQITDGSLISEDHVSVGAVGGTGSGLRNGNGKLKIVRGGLTAQRDVGVGLASGTGSPLATGIGVLEIEDGDLLVAPDPQAEPEFRSTLRVGSAGGTGSFQGTADGTLRVVRGDIDAETIFVGHAHGISRSATSARGELSIEGGDLRMTEMSVGIREENGVSAIGRVSIADGAAYGESLTVGPGGRVTLHVGDAPPALPEEAAALAIAPPGAEAYGKLRVSQVAIHGALEVSFAPGFQPAGGDVFDLIVADSLSTSFQLAFQGLSPEVADRMELVWTPTLFQLRFAVPEPSALLLTVVTAAACVGRSRTRRVGACVGV